MYEDRMVWINGDFIAWENATVHIMSHSFGRGSAIFEVISFYSTARGPAVFRLEAHIDRLFRSAELLDMVLPFSKEQLCDAVAGTVKRNELNQGFIKVICFYPEISFEIIPPERQLSVSVFALHPEKDLGAKGDPFTEGTTAYVSKWCKLDPRTVPIEAKAAANYLNGMVARLEAQKKGFKHSIMLDTQGYIAEGGTESAFFVKNECLLTPSTGMVLKSITRLSILESAKEAGIECIEKQLKPDLLAEADEIFLSSTPFKVLPVKQINDRKLPDAPGPVTHKIAELLNAIIAGNDDRFTNWLYFVE
ncbi:MAG: branched-chain-amino-acid transaminase [Desulfobacterales bacterium]|jgi:branched-chain amino acid aminotransferase